MGAFRNIVFGALACVACGVGGLAGAETQEIRAAAEKSVALLQQCGPTFYVKSGCVACHQQSVTSLAVAAARRHGLAVDEKTAREQVHVTALFARGYRDKVLERTDQPMSSAPSVGYIALGLAAEKYPPDEDIETMVIEMAGRQQPDGAWAAFSHRPPLEYSRVSSTALAIRAIQLYGPPGLKAQFDGRMERGRRWLEAAAPTSNHDQAFRALGLAWGDSDPEIIARQATQLLEVQRPDGGWSAQPAMDSDAFATGLTLYALGTGANIAPEHAAYQRGIEYLLRSQLADGSWHVRSRSFPFQPYFESGFPHGHDQWISATATGFAAVALMHALPAGSR